MRTVPALAKGKRINGTMENTMPTPTISVIFGTRPEAIKMAPIVLALKQQPDLRCHVCVTGQHRQMLDQVRDNLLYEHVPADQVIVTGNTVIDALFIALANVRAVAPAIPGLSAEILAGWRGKKIVLITGHRRENFGSGFESICQAIAELAHRFADVHFAYPVHLNPNVREPVRRILGADQATNIHLIDPLAYLPFVALMDQSTIVLTDSGGIQEEA